MRHPDLVSYYYQQSCISAFSVLYQLLCLNVSFTAYCRRDSVGISDGNQVRHMTHPFLVPLLYQQSCMSASSVLYRLLCVNISFTVHFPRFWALVLATRSTTCGILTWCLVGSNKAVCLLFLCCTNCCVLMCPSQNVASYTLDQERQHSQL